ncbi:MAG: sigma-70 family RNA polymerase sigma factor [Myxococcaceae bacterium]|nr:sigma-70 family RNA polymerase sigma factor [Myxococcaceae bacterium]
MASLDASEVDQLLERAHRTFQVAVERERLEAWLSEVAKKPPAALDPGIVLSCALFDQRPEALRCFEAFVTPKVKAALRKLGATDVAVEEHLQATRTRLLVEHQGARLKHYRGVGTFEAFVITTAVRALTDAHRGPTQRETSDEEPLAKLPAAVDLERQLARTGQSALFANAFRESLAALSPRERALLKLNLVDGASIDELAPLYQVSRATVARWLASARQALQRGTLERLSARTRLAGGDLDGLMASLESGFELSLRRFVTEAASGDA